MAIEPIYGMYVHDEVTDTDGIAKFSSEELEDIRVGADGVTYADAGDAVRVQVGEVKASLNEGAITLTPSDFIQGAWSGTPPQGNLSVNERNICNARPYKIKPGDKLITSQSSLYIRWHLFNDNDEVVEELKGPFDTTEIVNTEHVFSNAGTLYIVVANGYNWAHSSSITPTDMTATIKLITSYAGKEIPPIKKDINELQENTNLIFSKRLSETAVASENKYFFFPLTFLKDHTYIAKIKFSAFSSPYNIKYTLNTSTARSLAAGYIVQNICAITTTPTIEQEYVYKFKASARDDGSIAKYIALNLNVNGPTECTFEVYSVTAEDMSPNLDAFSDIVTLNRNVKDFIKQGTEPFRSYTTEPLTLLHFSDIHGHEENLNRIVEMKNHLGDMLDDTVCTGDMVSNNYSDTCMDFWNNVDGAEYILTCIGNHELADGEHDYASDQIGQTAAYQKYFAPYISNWNVTPAGENLTYWYKDYNDKKVRVIALNYLLTGTEQTAQNTWLAARLTEAKTNEYCVVILEHTPLGNFTNLNCNFSIIDFPWTYTEFPTVYQETVQDFIDNGGEFACYLAGHSHRDYVGYNSNYPEQLCIVITTALPNGNDNDQRRVVGEKSQDAANVVIVDTITKAVKLIRVGADMDCYLRGRHLLSVNYKTLSVIANS